MNQRLTAHDLFEQQHERLGLRWLAGQQGQSRVLESVETNARRPSLAGYLNIIYPNKVQILGSDGKVAHELEVTRRFNDPLVPGSRYDQIGGFLPDAEKKLTIETGWKVIIPAAKPAPAANQKGWRGIERFTKMGADVLKENYGGVKVGFNRALDQLVDLLQTESKERRP